jgi:chromosome segregation ATPase
LRNITFSGKGFVDKPANPDSIIFNKRLIDDLLEKKKNDNLIKTGVIENKPTISADTENMIMSDNIEKQVAEINDKLDTVSANCADQVAEAKATASKLEETNKQLEAAMNEKDEAIKAEQLKSEEAAAELETLAKEHDDEKKKMEEEMKKAKSDLEEAVATISEREAALAAAQAQLEEANEVIAGYKMKEEEMARKDKAMKRKASLVEAGLEEDDASAAVEKFEALDDETFDAMAAMMMKKKAMMKPEEEEKPKASEDEAEAALEEVEAEETVDLSVGSDESETESAEANIRSELVEFVSARLGKNSK